MQSENGESDWDRTYASESGQRDWDSTYAKWKWSERLRQHLRKVKVVRETETVLTQSENDESDLDSTYAKWE